MRDDDGRWIDVQVHYLPEPLVQAYADRDEVPRLLRAADGQLVDMGGGIAYPLLPELVDAQRRLELMDRDGIARSVLSVPPPGVDGLPGREAAAVARACNDELAALGPRLPALATLPAADGDAAAAELRRTVEAGLVGGVLYSNIGGRRPDEESFRPLFEAAADLDVPLVLHPATPAGLETPGFALPTTIGFIFETTLTTLRLVLGGVFDRHPELKLLLPHAGSVIPFLLGRIDYESTHVPGGRGALEVPPSTHLRRLYVDSACLWPPALRLALQVFGSERVLFASDEPFWRAQDGLATVTALELDEAERERVAHENAERLFRL
jgi:aminocarboxymuconate-semialdehyde decarboxylase